MRHEKLSHAFVVANACARLELSETAYLLGYENSNSFVRAFQRWEGVRPGSRRARVLQSTV